MDALIIRRGGVQSAPISAPPVDAPPASGSAAWVRNPSWPACEAVVGDKKVVGLYRVNPEGSNFFAVTCSGAYTVNFGDGTATDFTSGAAAYRNFDYTNANLVGTDAPVEFSASGSVITRQSHGYENGALVQFWNIVDTTEILTAQPYYVINKTPNSFQISTENNGPALTFANDGAATLLPYRIATVTITPQQGSNLTHVNFYTKHNQASLVNGYSSGWLDIDIACNTITSLTIGVVNTPTSNAAVVHRNLERVRIEELGPITSFSQLFASVCPSLKSVAIDSSISTLTDTSWMFHNCISLKSVSLFNTTSVTNMSGMFHSCNSLTSVPLFNTAAAMDVSAMFNACRDLVAVPLFNTASVTNISNIFANCITLKTIPLFNTAAATNMSGMFSGCTLLETVPLFNTGSATNMGTMFGTCVLLKTVPLFNTAAVTNMGGMFGGCRDLVAVPLFNTAAVTNMSGMFSSCISLVTIPLFNTASVTNMESMFGNCQNLTSVPELSIASIKNTNMFFESGLKYIFDACRNLSSVKIKNLRNTFSLTNCKLSGAELNQIYTNLATVSSATITVSGNYGVNSHTPSIATAKGWTVN